MTTAPLPTITVTGSVVRTWKSTNGQDGCLLTTPAGEELTLYGPLPPLQRGHTLTADVQGRTVIHARRIIREREIALAFYGQIRDVTRRTALKIVAELGDDTHQLITERFASLQGIKGLPASGLKSMQTHARRQGRWYTTLQQLADLGLPPEHTRALIKAEGTGAVRVFQENPYLAVQHDVPLRVIDHAALAQGLSAFDPRRNPALAFEVVRRAGQEHGHTCLPAAMLERELQDLHALEADEARSATEEAVSTGLLVHARGMHFLPGSHRTEVRLADDVARLLTAQVNVTPVPSGLPQLTDEQRRAVQLACLEALSVITGGPGTGKTTTLRALLETFENAGLRTLLCAPTGKAASRMQASTGQSATTLHRLLGYDGSNFEAGLLQTDAVIVDEVSMTSNLLLGTLLRSVPTGARVVLVGDADQLPPIDPGYPLAALIRTVPTTRLTRIHRQAQESPILTLAAQLISGEKPANSGVPFHPARTTAEVVELMERNVTPAGPPMLLTAGKAGPLGVTALNVALQDALNPGAGRFRVGDPVVVNRNDHHSGLMNGMTGRVAQKGTILRCDFDGELHTVDGPELDLAYAMTIHRSQGSEWDRVIVALSEDHERLLTRQLAYTAVTRAKRELIATGERSAWDLAALTPAMNRHTLLEPLLRD